MKYALIGCGRIATNHIKAVLNNHLEFAAVCDVVPEQMENLLAKHELNREESIHRYTDYREMIEKEQPEIAGEAVFEGMNFVITGSVEHFANRKELQELIESKGGKVTGSVTAKTAYLINNDAASNSSKNKKAKELGVPIISEEEFLRML